MSLFEDFRGGRSDMALLAEEQMSRGRTVAVLGLGDLETSFLPSGDAVQFPADLELNWNPLAMLDPLAMAANLEYLRSQGVNCLVAPASVVRGDDDRLFADHLRRYGQSAASSAVSIDLVAPTHVPTTCLPAIAARLELQLGRTPTVLDLTESVLDDSDVRGGVVSAHPSTVADWLEDSYDLVVVGEQDAALGHRLAREAALIVPSNGDVTSRTPLRSDSLPTRTPTVSIIIPTFNGRALLQSCLKSIKDWVPRWLDCEVIVADDGSSDDSAEFVSNWATKYDNRVVFASSTTNRGFLGNCNESATQASGDFLFFLNNDTLLMPDSVEALLRLPNVVSGSRLLFPDGKLQEAGGILYNDASAANIGKFDHRPSRPIYCTRRPVSYCSGAALMVPREIWTTLQGFDDHFAPAYYEDTDLCLRARIQGFEVIYQPESNVIHFEGATSGTSTDFGPKRSQLVNQEKFRKRWRGALVDHPAPPDDYDLQTIHRLVAYRPPVGGVQMRPIHAAVSSPFPPAAQAGV